ncbi:uncharacterized protein LOC119916466 isoform X2 [Micropterus salmoides]|uniref:uncharacterized protein LOC119916466 isoform X2 n=1 Tax=Micropterus salmoides TaxID=27706 RepID=UPI0018EBA196|nr:uncharacterized protein LOC119916466 isoform X2 [Micropterus salmoides]
MEDRTCYLAEEKATERKEEEVKLNVDRRRQKTMINIGAAFPKWKSLMRDKCFQSDAEVACFLLHSYERGSAATTPMKETPVQLTAAAVSSIGASGRMNRMGGALKKAPSIDRLPVIGTGEAAHDQPAREDPPDEASPCDQDPVFPSPQQVLCEDDIVGARASIVYEDCLRQLATFLILPVKKCTGLLKTGVCDCVAPFEINITSKGTATSVEWICPNGHSLWRWNSQPVMKCGTQAGDLLLSTNILLSGNDYAKVALLFKFMNMGMVKKNTFVSIQDAYCVDTVKSFWEERRTEALSGLQGKDVVVLDPDEGRYKDLGIHHSQDMWHGAKNLVKKIAAELWLGITHHVCDIYTWTNRRCQHGYLKERKAWIQRAFRCHKALVDIVLNERWLKDVHKYLRFSFRRLHKKNSRRHRLYALKSEKNNAYISELQARIVKRRITSGVGMPRRQKTVFPTDVQQLLVIKEEVPSECSPSLDQEDPELLHIKEEQEELWTSQEGEQLNGLEEADITRFPFTAVTVKSEDEEEKPQSPQLHQSQTEDNREAEPSASSSATQIKTETDGGSEPAGNLDHSHLQPDTDEKSFRH